MKREFNMVIVGAGGQGLITLLRILAEAAFFDGYDVKTSELHGLSQRGGSVEVHIRLDKKVFSPLVGQGGADFILGLEMQECLKGSYYANSKTVFLINKLLIPIFDQELPREGLILKNLKKTTKKLLVVPADDICERGLGNKVVAGIYLISLACFKGLIPLKPNSILKAIKKIIPEKYLELNKKAFELAGRAKDFND